MIVVVLLLGGCGNRPDPGRPQSTDWPATTTPPADSRNADDPWLVARRSLRTGDYDAAADAAYRALLEDPDSAEAALIASEAEAARGNHLDAAQLAGSIDRDSRLGRRAVEIHYQQLIQLNQISEAADVLLDALAVMPEAPAQWRHRAWDLLNRVGRREEASRQAEWLCRRGQATRQELLSLIRRNLSFPIREQQSGDPPPNLQPGLGVARWHFSQRDYERALGELSSQYDGQFESAAACALFGRLLAETQDFDRFPNWNGRCDDQVGQLSDYWAALGIYLYDQRQFEASARALLEAVYRDPTDESCFPRLAKVFGSLDERDKSEQFEFRGMQIGQTERLRDQLLNGTAGRDAEVTLAKTLATLGRPFETLGWTASYTPSSSPTQAVIQSQRGQLLQSEDALTMASVSSLCGVPLQKYELDGAMRRLAASVAPSHRPPAAEISAVPRLPDVASSVGIEFEWFRDVEFDPGMIPIHESVGGGIAVIDYDLDGCPDAYFAQGSGDPPTDQCTRSNVLVRNLAGRFVETTGQAGAEDYHYSSGLAAGDVNQDGFPDLWLGSLGRNRLLVNNGDGTFGDATDRLGSFEDRFTSSLAIADINGDALPDLFETNYIEMEGGFVVPKLGADGKPVMPGPRKHFAGPDRWWENIGDGTFRIHEIPRNAAKPGTSLGIVITDFDRDGASEVFVGNDMRPNHFLSFAEDNRFRNLADVKGVANGFQGKPNGCMGIAAADLDRDGLIDLFVTNFTNEAANLFIQSAGGLFADVAIRYGLDAPTLPMVGFGTKAIDFDRNGWLDLAITNGHIFDTRIYGEPFFQMPPQLLMNKGDHFQLVRPEGESGYWSGMYLGRAMASLDFDRDGGIDLLVGHMDHPVALLHNQTKTTGNWIQLELVGTACERDAIGTRVVVTSGQEQWTQWVTAGDGYLCTDEPVLDFSLGVDRKVDRVDVFWPRGEPQTFNDLQERRRYVIVQGEATALTR